MIDVLLDGFAGLLDIGGSLDMPEPLSDADAARWDWERCCADWDAVCRDLPTALISPLKPPRAAR